MFGRKSRFQNPLHQNYRHVRALAELLNVPEHVMRPLIFFFGDCEIKTLMPPNVLTRGLCTYIKSFRDEVFSPNQVDDCFTKLCSAKASPVASHRVHVASIRERLNGDICPKCGAALVLRTARKGTNVGSQFWGCSGYPNCRFIRPV